MVQTGNYIIAMLRRLVLLVCALGLLSACVPPEESNDRVKNYDPEENIMGVIQERGFMRIGVPIDYPPFAVSDGADIQGFVVEMGTLAAEALGVEPRFIPAPSYSLLSMVYVDEKRPEAPTEADLVFPMVPITEELVQEWTFTDPYWISHDQELVDGNRFIREGADYHLLREAFGNRDYKLAGEAQSTSGIGAAVRTGAATFATLVSQVFNEADAEGDWSRFYEEWLADYYAEPDPDAVPLMTLEDAAALYPAELE